MNERYRETWQKIRAWREDFAARWAALVREYMAERAKLTKRTRDKRGPEIDAKYTPLHALLTEERAQIDAAEKLLDDLAPHVQPTPCAESHDIDRCWTADYRTQTCAGRYAAGHLEPYRAWLVAHGFAVEIVYDKATDAYTLRANCEPWQWHALRRRVDMRWHLDTWRRCSVNARVYLPGLPYTGDYAGV